MIILKYVNGNVKRSLGYDMNQAVSGTVLYCTPKFFNTQDPLTCTELAVVAFCLKYMHNMNYEYMHICFK